VTNAAPRRDAAHLSLCNTLLAGGNMAFSDKILKLRKARGWSQERLAEELGVSRQSVSKWESGAAMPDLNRLTQLSQLFDTSLDDLVSDRELPERSSAPETEEIPMESDREPKAPPRVKWHKKPLIVLAALAALAGIVIIAVLILRPGTQPYTDAESIRRYLDESIDLHMPYAQIMLNDFQADTLRDRMEDAGLEVNANNRTIDEGIHLYIAGYFAQFEEYGITYDRESRQLYFDGRLVYYFEDYALEGALSQICWYDEEDEDGDGALILVERNARGTIKSVEDHSQYA